MIQVDYSRSGKSVAAFAPALAQAHTWLQEASGRGSDFVGWVNLPQDYDKEEYARIRAAARKIQGDSRALVVIGIGGSYLGARGAIEFLCSPNYNLKKKDTPNIYFAGNGLSADYLQEILDLIGAGKLDTTPLITHTFPLRDIEAAYDLFQSRRDGVMKVAITP